MFHILTKFKRLFISPLLAVLVATESLIAGLLVAPSIVYAATIRVPQDRPTIQAGIDAAQNGDLVLVSPGTYNERVTISGKTITLASQFHTTGDAQFIQTTIVDGGGGSGGPVITVDRSAGPDTKVIGFTIQNGIDGIWANAKLHILNNRIVNNGDGVDYASSGGINRNNVYENNTDDGVDGDGATDVLIEDNVIRNNSDDGIEIRLQSYSGSTLNIIIRNNVISGNLEDGIQLIDYPDVSDRVFRIERNLITGNRMVGLGLMDNGESVEDFRAASIPERIHLFNNTFSGNDHGVTGGDNLIALNNLFVNSIRLALKNVDAGSIAAYNLFWNNGTHYQGSNIDLDTTLFSDPLLDVNYRLQAGSPAIDAGTAHFEWNGETVLDLPPSAYSGAAPDLGRYEYGFTVSTSTPAATSTPTSTPAFAFTAAGDYGFGSDAAATLRGMGAAGAVFNLALGDLSYSHNIKESEWCQFVKDNLNAGAGRPAGNPFGESFPFQLITGNHENEPHQDDGYIDDFAACLPDRMNSVISPYGKYAREYYFDYQNARVILVGANNADGADPYDYVVGSNHYNWLRDRIVEAKNAGKWVIVGMHKVCVTMGVKTCEIGSDLMDLLIAQRVDLVLQGHEHNYQRSKQLTCATVGSFDSACIADDGADGVYLRGSGTVFVAVGTGGQVLTDVNTADAEAGYFARWMGLNVSPRKGMLKVTVSDTSLSAQFVGSTAGSFTDFFTINAPEPTPTPTHTPTPTLTPTSTDTPTPTPTDTATPTATDTPDPNATPTDTPTPTPTPTSTGTPTTTHTPDPNATPTDTPTPALTPTPTDEPTPEPTLEVLGTPEAKPLASLAIVTWQTNLEADSRLRFELSGDGCSDPWSGVITSTAYVVSHSVALVGLQPNTEYCYEVQSSDGNSTTAWIAGDPFTTLPRQFDVYLPLAIKAWGAPGPIRIAPYGDRTPKIPVLARLLSLLEQVANAIYGIQGMK